MMAKPQQEHEWLQKFVGEWTMEGEAQNCEAGGEPYRSTGTETVRSLGGLWVVGEGQGEMPGGGAATTIITIGYDPATGRYVGTWVGSMMTHLWVYSGERDATGKTLTLETEGPDMSPGAPAGKTAKYRDVVTLESDDHRVLKSFAQGPDGEWHQFMTAHYRRKK
jgi:hypothetical protein